MTPAQEKAKELVGRFSGIKDFALICVEEILNSLKIEEETADFIIAGLDAEGSLKHQYWNEVKQEI